MKKVYTILLVFLSLISIHSKATTITLVVNNGDWTSNATWDLNRVPQAGDTIIIPTAMTVNVYTNVSIAGYVYVQVYGTLAFNHSSKLDLGSTSKIFVHTGGKVTSTSSSASDQIRIGGTIVYKGNSGDLTGPVLLDNGGQKPVSEIPLPVKFVSFTLSRQQANVLVQWATAQESNSSHFVIERSENGKNWAGIGTVQAAGESSSLITYSFTDKNATAAVLYYRIKQVDLDGAFIYTSVAIIKSDNSNKEIKIMAASKNAVVINFPQQVKSNVIMRLISASGQIIAQQIVSNPSGQIVFSTANNATGVYIVNITDGHDLSIAKQVLL